MIRTGCVPCCETRLLLFVKAPKEGRVKTRLARTLDSGWVVGLYKCFVEDILETIRQCGLPLYVHYHPDGALAEMKNWLGPDREYVPQGKGNIGQKMAGAFLECFRQGEGPAMLIGSDFPDLPSEILTEAAAALNQAEVVIGPAADGGYYLIGFRKEAYSEDLFENISWSTSAVFRQTLQRLAERNLKVHVLPRWHDIDTASDLIAFLRRADGNAETGQRTIQYIRKKEFDMDQKPILND